MLGAMMITVPLTPEMQVALKRLAEARRRQAEKIKADGAPEETARRPFSRSPGTGGKAAETGQKE